MPAPSTADSSARVAFFAERFHARALKTPRSVRLALRYVLLNARKHAQGRPSGGALRSTSDISAGFIDRRSSAPWFHGFSRPEELAFGAATARSDWARSSGENLPPVVAPQSWLLRVGYQRAGPFDVDDTPGALRHARGPRARAS